MNNEGVRAFGHAAKSLCRVHNESAGHCFSAQRRKLYEKSDFNVQSLASSAKTIGWDDTWSRGRRLTHIAPPAWHAGFSKAGASLRPATQESE